MKKLVLFYSVVILFYGCSWSEHFIIANTSNENAEITYEIKNEMGGFSIFDAKPRAYSLSNNGTIDWEKPIDIIDQNISSEIIKVSLPNNTAIIIGTLSNDKYERYNQTFINDRHFNLKKVEIISSNSTIQITPAIFDAHFVKNSGQIKYVIK
jgi:hypothetical protein